MRPEEAEKLFKSSIIVHRQDITLAKDFLLKLPRSEKHRFDDLLSRFSRLRGFNPPQRISLRPDLDKSGFTQAIGDLISKFALAEATWGLIHDGILMHSGQVTQLSTQVQWTTVVDGSGNSGGWSFDEYTTYVPVNFSFTPSHRVVTNEEVLTDPDLFIMEAGIDGADPEISEAVEDSVRCFRNNLYRASAILLGKAMEGAWIELGLAFAKAIPTDTDFKVSKFTEMISDDSPLAKKLDEIKKLYTNRKELVAQILKNAEVRPSDLDQILIWSEVLRDARNAIHFGAKPSIPNSYEKVAVLLLAGAKSLSTLYRIKRFANHRS
jgi:hypothetical protein